VKQQCTRIKRGLAPFSFFEKGACPLFILAFSFFEKGACPLFAHTFYNNKKPGSG
jgi:hypothetical protein